MSKTADKGDFKEFCSECDKFKATNWKMNILIFLIGVIIIPGMAWINLQLYGIKSYDHIIPDLQERTKHLEEQSKEQNQFIGMVNQFMRDVQRRLWTHKEGG
jgi:hypothetical protein